MYLLIRVSSKKYYSHIHRVMYFTDSPVTDPYNDENLTEQNDMQRQEGKVTVKFLLLPSLIISIVLSIVLTIILNVLF